MGPREVKVLVIPPEGPVEVRAIADTLEALQGLVGGHIEAAPLPPFIEGQTRGTAYVNEDGKHDPECAPNGRATDFMVPGVGLFWGDYVAGTLIVLGFDPRTGEHLPDPPEAAVRRARLIESEAGR